MPSDHLVISATLLATVAILALAALKGWQDWIGFKQRELDSQRPDAASGAGTGMARIEIADLKERIRKLEAIAAGVDL